MNARGFPNNRPEMTRDVLNIPCDAFALTQQSRIIHQLTGRTRPATFPLSIRVTGRVTVPRHLFRAEYTPTEFELSAEWEMAADEAEQYMQGRRNGGYPFPCPEGERRLGAVFEALPEVEEVKAGRWQAGYFDRSYYDEQEDYHCLTGYDFSGMSTWGRQLHGTLHRDDWPTLLRQLHGNRDGINAAVDELLCGPREGRPTKWLYMKRVVEGSQ